MMKTTGGQGWVGYWAPEKFVAKTEKQVARGMAKAAALLVREAKNLVSRPGVKKTTPFGTTKVGGKRVARGTEGGDIVRVSRPGEPPRRRTGALMGAIHMEQTDEKGLEYKVGVPHGVVPYALALELGYMARNLKPRPYLRAALARVSREMSQVIIATAKSKFQRPALETWSSAELTGEDVARGRKNVFFQEPPAMGEK